MSWHHKEYNLVPYWLNGCHAVRPCVTYLVVYPRTHSLHSVAIEREMRMAIERKMSTPPMLRLSYAPCWSPCSACLIYHIQLLPTLVHQLFPRMLCWSCEQERCLVHWQEQPSWLELKMWRLTPRVVSSTSCAKSMNRAEIQPRALLSMLCVELREPNFIVS